MGKALKKVENEFNMAGGNVTTAMLETLNLFRDRFTAQEQSVIQKALNALDVGAFIYLISTAMQRA
jgi:hypothetical protein